MQKAIVILGSPRKNGNSTILANRAMEGMKAVGGTYEVFYLHGMNIHPCQACDSCKQDNLNECVVDDDMQLIYPKLVEADAILISSPIYMFTISAQMKLFMDRCYANYPVLNGKRIGVVLTYGGTDEYDSGAINAINTIKDQYGYIQSEIVGIVHGR